MTTEDKINDNLDSSVQEENIDSGANADFRSAPDEQQKLSVDNGDYTFKFHNDHVHVYALGGQPLKQPTDVSEFVKLIKKFAGAACRVTAPNDDNAPDASSGDAVNDLGKDAYALSKDMEFKPE